MEFFESAFERIKILARLQTRNVKRTLKKKKKKKKTWKRNRKSNETRELKNNFENGVWKKARHEKIERNRDAKARPKINELKATLRLWIRAFSTIDARGRQACKLKTEGLCSRQCERRTNWKCIGSKCEIEVLRRAAACRVIKAQCVWRVCWREFWQSKSCGSFNGVLL
jgi:hypothetical protein